MISWQVFVASTIVLVVVSCHGVQSEEDYSDFLKTVGLFFYSPFYHEEQMLQRNVKLDGFLDDVPIKVLIHGYIASRYHVSIAPIKNAYLSAGNVNLFIVDWSQASYQMYDVSRQLTSQVAHRVSEILERFISENNIDRGLIHVIGHSLGAHIAGNVGRYMGGSLGRITGLDPAAPLYIRQSYDAIQITDASFVDIIHTNGEALGEIWARGHIDFYPNYGLRSQPGCGVKDITTLFSCSHFRSVEYFAESILNPNAFIGVKCPLNDILTLRKCTSKYAEKVIMGEYTPRESRGTYFLETNGESPYGKSNYSRLYER